MLLRDALHAHHLVARCLTADHAHARGGTLSQTRNQGTQRGVGLAVDRRRRDPHDDRLAALTDDLVALGARLQPDRDQRVFRQVPGVGLEPTRPGGQSGLSRSRLTYSATRAARNQ